MVKLAYYKATHGTWYDKLIAWWTRPNFWNPFKTGKYSHIEIVFTNGECFSSSPRDGGTRWKHIDNLTTSGHWDFYEFPPSVGEVYFEKTLIAQCNRYQGLKYDWVCIFFTNFIPAGYQVKRRWTCSEFVARFVFWLPNPSWYTPNKIAATWTPK